MATVKAKARDLKPTSIRQDLKWTTPRSSKNWTMKITQLTVVFSDATTSNSSFMNEQRFIAHISFLFLDSALWSETMKNVTVTIVDTISLNFS